MLIISEFPIGEKLKIYCTMKRLTSILTAFIFIEILILTACDGSKRITPEEEVRNFGKFFVEKLNVRQLDSLKSSYPDIVKSDSNVPLQSDTIIVVETGPGKFDVTLAEGIILKVNRSNEGDISVSETKGLFAFPADKVDIAKKTGLWDDEISDAQLNERMKDEAFFKYIQDQIKKKTSNIIQIGEFIYSPNVDDMIKDSAIPAPGSQTLTNLSDVPLDGSEYTIVKEEYFCAQGVDERSIKTEKGKAIPKRGSIKIMSEKSNRYENLVKKIKWNLTPEQLQEKFAPFTGNEYQEYLNSQK